MEVDLDDASSVFYGQLDVIVALHAVEAALLTGEDQAAPGGCRADVHDGDEQVVPLDVEGVRREENGGGLTGAEIGGFDG